MSLEELETDDDCLGADALAAGGGESRGEGGRGSDMDVSRRLAKMMLSGIRIVSGTS